MKKLFILLILLSSGLLHSQEFIPILNEGAYWDVQTTGPGTCSYLNRYRIKGTFTHNGIEYHKMETAPIRGMDNPIYTCHIQGDPFVDENEFTLVPNLFIRESEADKRVYMLHKNDQDEYQEYTVADYTLEVGDELLNAFTYEGNGSNSSGLNLTIESITVASDGRKRFWIEGGAESYEEGIGSNQGPAQHYRPNVLYDDQNSVSCYGHNNLTTNNCAIVLSSDDFQLSQINVFPNPTSGYIKFSNLERNTFKLYSILGKQMTFEFSEETQEMNISHLETGIYFLQIQGKNNSQRIIKIIKN